MPRRKQAKTRRTMDRLNAPHNYDLVDVLEGQTPGTIDDSAIAATERCVIHDRPYCQHCTDHGARIPGWRGVDPVHWGPKKDEPLRKRKK